MKEVRKVQKRRQRCGTSWVFPIPIFRLSDWCFQFLSPVFSVAASPTFPVYIYIYIWFAALALSCDYYISRCSLWLTCPWNFRVAPAATATASGGEAPRPPPQPPSSSFMVVLKGFFRPCLDTGACSTPTSFSPTQDL